MKKRVFFASVILIFLSTYTLKINNSLDKKIQIEKITIENNKILDDQTIKKKISFLYEENLFFLNNFGVLEQMSVSVQLSLVLPILHPVY